MGKRGRARKVSAANESRICFSRKIVRPIFGLLMAHFAVRGLMHEAALKADEDPDRLSFLHSVRVVRRKITGLELFPPQERVIFREAVLDEILDERGSSNRSRFNPRGVKRKMSSYPLRPRMKMKTTIIFVEEFIRIIVK